MDCRSPISNCQLRAAVSSRILSGNRQAAFGDSHSLPAYTLLEVTLVIGLLVAISAIAIPNFIGQLEREELPGSVRQLRSLISLTRANAAYDGKRYRIRFPSEEEKDLTGDTRQPIVEREDDPIHNPEFYVAVTAPWALGSTFLGKVWCAEVRTGRPTIEDLQDLRERGRQDVADELMREQENLEPDRPPLYIEPDGASEWATFVITSAPRETPIDELEEHPRIELIVEGSTGLAWIQRPFYDEELDLFEEKGWPAVLRQDFLDPRELTENDVLELREITVKP
jgi:type II secretory pathway pseudopilin PulG